MSLPLTDEDDDLLRWFGRDADVAADVRKGERVVPPPKFEGGLLTWCVGDAGLEGLDGRT